MWNTIKEILLSQHKLSAIVYLVIGAIIGAIVSVLYSVKAQRPRLIISSQGSGSDQQHQHYWSIGISNRPSFFGQNLYGEPARNVQAHLQVKETRSQSYPVYWDGQMSESHVTIEPGQQKSLKLFYWKHDSRGFFIIDNSGEPVTRFQVRNSNFVLKLIDQLDRVTEFPFTVNFDDTHLKNIPQLQIVFPLTLNNRYQIVKRGVRNILLAFSSR